jgi:hypothetical protein
MIYLLLFIFLASCSYVMVGTIFAVCLALAISSGVLLLLKMIESLI